MRHELSPQGRFRASKVVVDLHSFTLPGSWLPSTDLGGYLTSLPFSLLPAPSPPPRPRRPPSPPPPPAASSRQPDCDPPDPATASLLHAPVAAPPLSRQTNGCASALRPTIRIPCGRLAAWPLVRSPPKSCRPYSGPNQTPLPRPPSLSLVPGSQLATRRPRRAPVCHLSFPLQHAKLSAPPLRFTSKPAAPRPFCRRAVQLAAAPPCRPAHGRY